MPGLVVFSSAHSVREQEMVNLINLRPSGVMLVCVARIQSRQNATTKRQVCDDSKREYESEVAKMKVVQEEHYKSAMPRIFQVS